MAHNGCYPTHNAKAAVPALVRQAAGGLFTAALIALCASQPAAAQILNPVRGGGFIEFNSGYPGGVFTTGVVNPIPPGGFFLERVHNPPLFGTSRGGTALRVLVFPNRVEYLFAVPVNSYLQQLRRSCPAFGATPPARLKIHFDVHFDIGPEGLPGGPFRIAYPLRVANTLGLGSYSALHAGFTFDQKVNGVEMRIGQGGFTSLFPFRGQVFQGIVPRPGEYQPIVLPRIPPNSEFIVWGDIIFTTLGCPVRPFGAAGAGMSELPSELGVVNAADGGTLWDFGDIKFDPKTTYDEIDPDLIMDMDDSQPFVGCAQSCGGQSPDGCSCDPFCTKRGDTAVGGAQQPTAVCCSDQFLCGYGQPGCSDYCGGQTPEGCYCDSECEKFNDCCPDVDVCPVSKTHK